MLAIVPMMLAACATAALAAHEALPYGDLEYMASSEDGARAVPVWARAGRPWHAVGWTVARGNAASGEVCVRGAVAGEEFVVAGEGSGGALAGSLMLRAEAPTQATVRLSWFNRLSRAEAAAQTNTAQARQRQLESALSVGTALLSAFTGRKLNTATASRAGTALRSVGRVQQQQQSAAQAQDSVEGLREQILNLEQELEAEVAALSASFDPASAALEEVQISATATNISVRLFGLLWLPYHRDRMGRLQPDW